MATLSVAPDQPQPLRSRLSRRWRHRPTNPVRPNPITLDRILPHLLPGTSRYILRWLWPLAPDDGRAPCRRLKRLNPVAVRRGTTTLVFEPGAHARACVYDRR